MLTVEKAAATLIASLHMALKINANSWNASSGNCLNHFHLFISVTTYFCSYYFSGILRISHLNPVFIWISTRMVCFILGRSTHLFQLTLNLDLTEFFLYQLLMYFLFPSGMFHSAFVWDCPGEEMRMRTLHTSCTLW